MSGKNRYYSSYPSINPSYLSGGTQRVDNVGYTFEDIVTPNTLAVKSNIVLQPHIEHNIFTDTNGKNVPISSSNFNVINLSVDTNLKNDSGSPLNDDNDSIFVDILQGNSHDSLEVSYTTPIPSNEIFFKKYPVRNNFVDVQFRNNKTNNVHIDYDFKFSKFTQMNPPVQQDDFVEFKAFSNLSRDCNNFNDDVSRNLYENSSIINRFGYIENNVTRSQIVAPIDIQVNTSNTFVEVFGVSDSPADVFEMTISGETDNFVTHRLENAIDMLGTSNSLISVSRYKYIDTVELPQTNTGNITIYKNGTLDPVAYIPKGYGNVSSPLYFINTIEQGVLKEIKVRGLVSLQNGSLDVKTIQGTNETTLWTSGIIDGVIDNSWSPDALIPSNTTVYAVVNGLDTTLHGNQRLDVSMKINKYELQPVNTLES